MGKQRWAEDQTQDWRGMRKDQQARNEGPDKRNWTRHDLRDIRPRTERQRDAIRSYLEGNDIAMLGTAGTGKSLVALYLAAHSLTDERQAIEQIIVIRAPVPAIDQGFLPGDLDEKQAVYEDPYPPLLAKLFGPATTYEKMKAAGKLVFRTPSYLRGVTFDNAVVVLEEVQNCAFEHIDTVMTRLGENSRIIVTGDTRQMDLNRTHGYASGIRDFIQVSRDMNDFEIVEFNKHDIVRGPRVRSWITACESLVDSRKPEPAL